jgi:ribose transport system ATP-binding protein
MVATPNLLEVRNLGKTFPGQVALAGVDLDVRAGEVHAIVGENGCGKSTLIKILAGYHDPDPGSEVIVRAGDGEAGAIGFVHQDLALIDSLNVVDNLALGRGFKTKAGVIDRRGERLRAQALMERLGRQVNLDVPLSQLQPVERSLVAMARALEGLGDSSVLVLDEPTAALPAPEVSRLFEAIEQIKAGGGGVLYVSHRLDEIFAIADRVTVLRDGRRVATAEIGDLDHDGLIELMIGHVLDKDSVRRVGISVGAPVLEIENLSGQILRGFSATVRAGEIVGVAGLVGSGREELAGAIIGAEPGTTGVVRVAGKKLKRRTPRGAIDAGLALVPADRAHLGAILEHSIAENVTLPKLRPLLRRSFLHAGRERAEVGDWIDQVGLVPRDPDRVMGTLSGGNQQKAVLARWLRLKPTAIILDEPTQGVDVGAKDMIYRLLDDVVGQGVGLLLCTAETEDLVDVCDRVLVLRDGRIAAELQASELSTARIVKESLAETTVAA